MPPVLLIVFRRAGLTRQMLESIRDANPPKVYIACDGPRPNRPDDVEKVRAVRAVIDEFENELHPEKLYQETNLGCGKGESTAMSWFFENEEEGIVLEDDCLPDPSFYRFCGEMLERYRNVTNVMQIAGYNDMSGECPIDADYRFSHYGWSWGWAGWRRAWKHFDLKMESWPEFKSLGLHKCASFCEARVRVCDEMYAGNAIDTWDFQWQYAMAANYGLSIIPKYSLIKNVGAGLDCAHGVEGADCKNREVLVRPVEFPLKHPKFIVPDPTYDHLWEDKVRVTTALRLRQCAGHLLRRLGLMGAAKAVLRRCRLYKD